MRRVVSPNARDRPPVPNRHVERQLLRMPITTHIMIMLPNVCWFAFQGVSTYLEALLPQNVTPHLEEPQILFFNQLSFSVRYLLEFLSTTESLRFGSVRFNFSATGVTAWVYSCEEVGVHQIADCCRLSSGPVHECTYITSLSGPGPATGSSRIEKRRCRHGTWESQAVARTVPGPVRACVEDKAGGPRRKAATDRGKWKNGGWKVL
ncbi:hypothetical protein BC826DRAFT_1034116 [Russula brevipes]|nr:hypothetical protein BC826DRAFT_1034116 [Russula brevipes]